MADVTTLFETALQAAVCLLLALMSVFILLEIITRRRERLAGAAYWEAVRRESAALIEIVDGLNQGAHPDKLRAIAMGALYPHHFAIESEGEGLPQLLVREA